MNPNPTMAENQGVGQEWPQATIPLDNNFPFPPTDLPETDGKKMDSDWQRRAIDLLSQVTVHLMQGREDYYAGGNMFIHFSAEQVRNREFLGPDFFVVVGGVSRVPIRPYWAVWNENGRYPDLIVELLSPTTRKEDLTIKKEIYRRTFRTQNFFCYDPETNEWFAWRLDNDAYQPIPANHKGWFWCDALSVWLGPWKGEHEGYEATWLRFYDTGGNLVPTLAEAALKRAEWERLQAEAAKNQAEAAKAQAKAAKSEAEAALQQAEEHRRRAEALAAELASLKARLGNP